MAYYTIAHIIHGSVDNLMGVNNKHNLSPEHFTDEVFDFIFLAKSKPTTIAADLSVLLDDMKQEFEYWYPMDLRVSAKDLIPNHLTMSLYNHVEIWKDRPEMWPKGIYCNGHVMVDAEKMSKSKGNFLMLLQCVEEYSADATRFALADAGDTLEDANFDRSVANQAITYLYNEEEWILSVLAENTAGKLRDGELTFMDKTLLNELSYLVDATYNEFNSMRYRDGLHRCWFDMTIARDLYRDWALKCNIAMHKSTVLHFIEALVIMISPICPHWAEGMWAKLRNSTEESVCNVSWPTVTPYDKLVRKQYIFFRDFLKNARQAAIKAKVTGTKTLTAYLANTFEAKKITLLKYLASVVNDEGQLPDDFLKQMKEYLESTEELKKDTKILMQFGAFMRDEVRDRGVDALAVESPFDQKAILEVCHSQPVCTYNKDCIMYIQIIGECGFYSKVS
jgi:leucyl-tRNA synthetase